MTDLDLAFRRRITAEPENQVHRLVYADWLEEQGDPRGELLRIQERLRQADLPDRPRVEERMRAMLAVGVEPLTISRTNSLGMEFVLIFPGSCLLGSPGDESERFENEPQQLTTLPRSWWIGRYPVTRGQWRAIMAPDAPPDEETGLEQPASFMTWERAGEFAARLTAAERQAGRLGSNWGYALPAETQWEYACRAGTTTRFWFGDDPGYHNLVRYAWFRDNAYEISSNRIPDVGTRPPNPWNLYDMHGLVWEWCRELLPFRPADHLTGVDDTVAHQHVARGGCWGAIARYLRSACRDCTIPGFCDDCWGFRLVLEQFD